MTFGLISDLTKDVPENLGALQVRCRCVPENSGAVLAAMDGIEATGAMGYGGRCGLGVMWRHGVAGYGVQILSPLGYIDRTFSFYFTSPYQEIMAPPRKPSNVLALKGSFKKNPARGADRVNEPEPVGEIGEAPPYLDENEKSCWHGGLNQVESPRIKTATAGTQFFLTVLLTVLFKIHNQEPSIHAGCSLKCDSGPGTTFKALL